ncbi:methylated-DNA--[protein]-cysteine S-methyltransferase [Kiloniella laminariae]|uniref:Methylated-DNA--[protein]-cysteine S-methyltransferase n=1 Tax=Kiloniella laminariae TaxID=454162 RepID=A0ABT4LH89_9PROT|nr:methylated-DNA--[protein]-cysteine S-methyltransferase [Kiloniella laminariae]MCZ4280466.1 methylated-DNA--[protein]-cysteine S-methyltransferase [Kiloniella laminariae]
MILFSRHVSPLGEIMTFYHDGVICQLDFADCRGRWQKTLDRRFPGFALEEGKSQTEVDERLRAYFDGGKNAFAGLALDMGGTVFQRSVWTALQQVPFGERRTYSEVAAAIGKPDAVRAMAAANAFNPLSIIIPCHRVLGKSGALTGYGGGVARKRALLCHEDPAFFA